MLPTDRPRFAAPTWVDLLSGDLKASTRFYTRLFGWEATRSESDDGASVLFTLDGAPVAGATEKPADAPFPDVWFTYLATDDLGSSLVAATRSGGQVFMPATELGADATVAMIADPSGAAVGLWQATELPGFPGTDAGAPPIPGVPFGHELVTDDLESAAPFYRDAFGWPLEYRIEGSPTDDAGIADLAIASADGTPFATLHDAPGALGFGTPPHWRIVWLVLDLDDAAKRARKLGARPLGAPIDREFGRTVELSDPTGATIVLGERPRSA